MDVPQRPTPERDPSIAKNARTGNAQQRPLGRSAISGTDIDRFLAGEASAEELGPDFFVAPDGTKGFIVDDDVFDRIEALRY